MQPLSLPVGATVFAAGDPSLAVYIIQDGEIAISVDGGDGATEVARLQPGELFGESGVLEGRPRSATAIATAPTTLLVTPAETFLHAFGMDNQAALTLVKLICQRLRSTTRRMSQQEPGAAGEPPEAARDGHGAIRLLPDSERMTKLLGASGMEVSSLPFQVGNRFGGETLPIASNRTCCLSALGDADLSAPHFEILQRSGRIGVRDLGSRFGTVVNGHAIGRGSLEAFVFLPEHESKIIAGRASSPFRFRLLL